jgi:hypothetical protein
MDEKTYDGRERTAHEQTHGRYAGGVGVGWVCISGCVGESPSRSWHEAQGPTTPFSASFDAENGSLGPNRNLQVVIL